MTWETVSGWEALLLAVALVGMVIHAAGLRVSLADRRCLNERGLNGARRLVVAGHVRGHVSRLVVNGVVIAFALFLMGRTANPADQVAPRMLAGALLVTLTLTVDSALAARERRELEGE